MTKIRVLVVDDSAFMRKIISEILASQEDMEVVGMARDGLEALDKAAALAPDVITMDVEMPRMDGLAALARLMADNPTPVVMVSSLTWDGADATMRALTLGAVDFVPKPSGVISLDMRRQEKELVRKVRAAARVRREALRHMAAAGSPAPAAGEPARRLGGPGEAGWRKTPGLSRVVVIGASTGGPSALARVLSRLPGGYPAGVLVVQHMPAGFTRSLAQHLNAVSALEVAEAVEGDVLVDGRCLIAPGGRHMIFRRDGTVGLDDSPTRHGVRPAVDITLESVAEERGEGAIAVILTGMGRDGASGALKLKRCGGTVIAQDATTAVIYGMPRAVAEAGAADFIVPLDEIPVLLAHLAAGQVVNGYRG